MNNQTNPYQDSSNQPPSNNQQAGRNQAFNYPQNQGYQPPRYYQGGNYPAPPPPQPIYNNNPYNIPNNQGFVPNQGYVPNQRVIPAGQGYIPGPQICQLCNRQTDSFPRKVAGGVTWIWCFGLFIFTGLCCCIPFCVDSCLDTELVCVVCQSVKSRMEANCC